LILAGMLLSFSTLTLGCVKKSEVLVSDKQVVEQNPVEVKEVKEMGKVEIVEKQQSVTAIKIASDSEQKVAPKPSDLGLEQLVERLKKTEAIGFLTKLAIRADVLDFKKTVDSYRKRGENTETLRSRFDGLVLKILALLEHDPDLSKDIHFARESIWNSLVEVKS